MSTKILVIDASAADLVILKNMLKDYLVLTARNSFEAMQHIKANSDIRLILLNSNMPNGESFQILKKFKSDERYKKMRIVILSDNDTPENEMNCLKLGAVDYIRKPFYRESLNATIKMHLDCLWIQRWYEEMLFGSSQMLNTILNQVPVGIAIINSNEPFTAEFNNQGVINPVYEQITGRTREELIQIGWDKITHPEDLDKNLKYLKQMQLGKVNSFSMEKRYIKPDGSIVWVHMVAARLNLKNGYKYNRICIVQDITERKKTESILYESERSKSVLLNNLPGIAFRCKPDKEWTMEFVSQGSYDLTGYKAESLIGNRDISYNDLIAPEYRDAVRREWELSYAKKVPFEYEYEIITASGQRKWVMEKGQSIFDERGALEALEGIIIDISDRKRQELQNKYLIELDPVTGLYNRRYLKNLLENDARSKANVKRAILNINLRKIELLTSANGFHYRQELLKKISTVLSSLCTSNCQLYSTYANRFTFYFTGYHDKNDLVQLCNNIKELLTPILLSEGIGVGVGILEIEDNDAEAKRILKNVLIASEHALSDTNQIYNCSFFDKEMESAILRQVKIKDLLRKIADGDDGNLYLQFQPILNLKSGSIFCFEALTRLRSEELGIISPLEFIPIAEETKLIVPIGKKIIYNALSFLKKLKAEGHDSVKISINVSAIQLLTTDFNSCLFEFLDKLGIAPTNLIIELTESIFAENYPEINKKLGELIATGINIAIDDFGTGYSSLAREQELNVNCLKIDKYFIDKLVCPNPKGAITSDIISMAHKFGHYVVAEGVENEVQKQYLLKHGCDMVQGYLISRPLDEKVALDFVRKQRIRNLQRYRESYGSVSKNLYR